jgi:type II secretory pathway pseudopilin PulG
MMQQPNVVPTTATRRFTLVEMLVVVVIILILAGLLLPALSQARARAKMTKCTGQLTQFGQALVMYRDDHDKTMIDWMSNLSPAYGTTAMLYKCPSDPSGGLDGSRPGSGWPENTYGGNPISISGVSSPDGSKDAYGLIDARLTDQFFNTDDTFRNQIAPINAMNRNPAIRASSYLYEFSDAKCTWYDDSRSWNSVKEEQRLNGFGRDDNLPWNTPGRPWDDHLFPAVRCFYHFNNVWGKNELVLNTSYEGGFFRSKLKWEEGIWD